MGFAAGVNAEPDWRWWGQCEKPVPNVTGLKEGVTSHFTSKGASVLSISQDQNVGAIGAGR